GIGMNAPLVVAVDTWRDSFFFLAEDGIRDGHVTGVQTCALPISAHLSVGGLSFANLSRQSTNRQLRRLARAGLAGLERRVVDVHNLAALRGVAAGRGPAPR